MIKTQNYFGMTEFVKITFITMGGVFKLFFCPDKLFTKNVITPTFSTSTGFMMVHFEAKIHAKTIESLKSNVVQGQMSTML